MLHITSVYLQGNVPHDISYLDIFFMCHMICEMGWQHRRLPSQRRSKAPPLRTPRRISPLRPPFLLVPPRRGPGFCTTSE